ncbi:MAG: AAA family ATPase [Candidatus Delongbacteria bacterium]|nr:AAA family ATPase [Candidatus Delongbacteria bacterium]MBN2836548.1 AAA family ATPase [Candidatus Delongbacteria bacterium]
MKNIAVSLASFESIIDSGFIYIDKTSFIHKIVSSPEKYFFLSRPRRFGKSLSINTLREVFLGNKELFKGLYIYDTDWKWGKYPIIQLDFNKIDNSTPEKLEENIIHFLSKIYTEHYIKVDRKSAGNIFEDLVIKLHDKYNKGVVFLVDEYDKPIISHLGEGDDALKIAKENQKFMKIFYDNLKALEPYLKTVYITGVSKFSRVSIFSTLNNLIELDYHPEFADFLGYREDELHTYFDEHFAVMADEMKVSKDELYELFRRYYNGFRFTDKDVRVYNPFSVGRALSFKQLRNFWFESGTPTFLVNLIKEKQYNLTNFQNLEISTIEVKAYDIENLQIEALLFQTGYLTIKDTFNLGRKLLLSFPNSEVSEGFNKQLLSSISEDKVKSVLIFSLQDQLFNLDFDNFFKTIKTLFASVAYNIIPRKDDIIDPYNELTKFELYYHSLFYLIISLMSDIYTKVDVEVLTNIGRLDMVVKTPDRVFIFEFKVDQSADIAIKQIKNRKYADKFIGKKITMIGIDFGSEEKNIKDWIVEEME